MEYAALWDVQTQTVNEIKGKDVLMKILIDNRTQLSEICMFKILEKIYDKVNNEIKSPWSSDTICFSFDEISLFAVFVLREKDIEIIIDYHEESGV